MRFAKRGGFEPNKEPYLCQHGWPDDCFVQCGGCGIVLDTRVASIEGMVEGVKSLLEGDDKIVKQQLAGSRTTAFFEAFPKALDTYIRGEGSTVEQAETHAWDQYQKRLACPQHEFERRGYKAGQGICKHCGLFNSKAFKPLAS